MAVYAILFAVAALYGIQCATAIIVEDDSVAFFADYTGGSGSAPAGQKYIAVFPHVVTNVGGAYDGKSGKFTAPYTSTYEFTYDVQSKESQGWVALSKNGADVCQVHFFGNDWNHGGKTVILELNKGDTVWVTVTSGLVLWPSYESGFSGKALPSRQFHNA